MADYDFFCAHCESAESDGGVLRMRFSTGMGAMVKAPHVVMRLSKDEYERLWVQGPDDPLEFLELLTKHRIAQRDGSATDMHLKGSTNEAD